MCMGTLCLHMVMVCAHLAEDEVSDQQEEKSRHEPREQRGDEPG